MGLFAKLFRKTEDTSSYSFRKKTAQALHGQPVKYVTERREDNDDVVGRGGHLTLKDDDTFLVDASGEVLLKTRVEDLNASYLMSGDGVIITAPNLLEDGKERTLTVHFVYYRK